MTSLRAGMKDYYARRFGQAESDFRGALKVVPDNTLALAYLNAAADKEGGTLELLSVQEENAISADPTSYVNHIRLAFTYIAQSLAGRERNVQIREELATAAGINAHAQAAHVGLGIIRYNEGSMNSAKAEFLAALRDDPNNVLAREYLGQIYQSALDDPQRALSYVIPIVNLVPDYADIHFHIGSILYDLKQSREAIRYVTTGLELDTGHVSAAGEYGYTLLGRIFIEEHKLDDARRVLNVAVRNKTDAPYAKILLEKISKGQYDRKPAGT
ncbi:MAG: hypothetical protein M3Z14_00770 [Candidatus Eremiobacteraeota bacterium]|nr:hypothetical protein [Candidatus Eremiobacteraeota bacterium]